MLDSITNGVAVTNFPQNHTRQQLNGMSETVAEMTDERLIEHIAGMVCVGWRKGVDGYGSSKIYNTINGGAWKSEARIQEMVNSNVVAIARAAAPLIRRNAPSTEIGAAIKEASCVRAFW